MKKLAILSVAILGFLTGCPADMWIPVETTPRPAVPYEHVMYLDAPPTRPFVVLGIITPPSDEYDTEAEAVKAIRKEAARHGADAIMVESLSEGTGWRFGLVGSKGSFKTMTVRAKAIAWTGNP